MKKDRIIVSIAAMLFLSLTTLTAQTQCDPPGPLKKTGRCAIFNDPDGDIAVCNDVPVVGAYCGYGTIGQT